MTDDKKKLDPMAVWHFLAPLILEFEKNNECFIDIYVTTFHALQLEDEWRKKEQKNE